MFFTKGAVLLTEESIKEGFHHYFEITVANTPQLLDEVFKIRYQVYSEEMGFEPENSAHIENDDYDDSAIHVLIKYRPTDRFIGTIRMVLNDKKRKDFVFPMETHCKTMDKQIFDIDKIDRQTIGEISRVAVIQDFRRRKEDAIGLAGAVILEDDAQYHRTLSYVPLSLYFASHIIAMWENLSYTIAISEPKLMRHIHFTGIQAKQFGASFEFKGERAPYFFDKREIDIIPKFQPLYDIVENSLQESYNAYTSGAA